MLQRVLVRDLITKAVNHGGEHVRRCAGWIEPVIHGLNKLGVTADPRYKRQIAFIYQGARYVGRYLHATKISGRSVYGVLEIARLDGRGSIKFTSFEDALDFCNSPHLP